VLTMKSHRTRRLLAPVSLLLCAACGQGVSPPEESRAEQPRLRAAGRGDAVEEGQGQRLRDDPAGAAASSQPADFDRLPPQQARVELSPAEAADPRAPSPQATPEPWAEIEQTPIDEDDPMAADTPVRAQVEQTPRAEPRLEVTLDPPTAALDIRFEADDSSAQPPISAIVVRVVGPGHSERIELVPLGAQRVALLPQQSRWTDGLYRYEVSLQREAVSLASTSAPDGSELPRDELGRVQAPQVLMRQHLPRLPRRHGSLRVVDGAAVHPTLEPRLAAIDPSETPRERP